MARSTRVWKRLMALVVLIAATSATARAALPYRDDFVVYTSDKEGFARPDVKALFDRTLLQNKPMVLFIHGRGDEPEKSLNGTNAVFSFLGFEGRAVSKLETYGAKVILFSWDSKHGKGRDDRSRPLSNMPAAQERLSFVLDRLVESVSDAERAGRLLPPITLVAHSMGTIVLQRYIEAHGWSPRGTRALFTTVVVSSSDADNINHRRWVDPLGSVERVFVTANPTDGVLLESAKQPRELPNAKPLGLDPGADVSNAATYIHLEKTKAHEIFEQKAKNPEIAAFFRSVIQDTEVRLGRPKAGPGRQFFLK